MEPFGITNDAYVGARRNVWRIAKEGRARARADTDVSTAAVEAQRQPPLSVSKQTVKLPHPHRVQAPASCSESPKMFEELPSQETGQAPTDEAETDVQVQKNEFRVQVMQWEVLEQEHASSAYGLHAQQRHD